MYIKSCNKAYNYGSALGIKFITQKRIFSKPISRISQKKIAPHNEKTKSIYFISKWGRSRFISLCFVEWCYIILSNCACIYPIPYAHQRTAQSTQSTVCKHRDTATKLQLTCIWFHYRSPFRFSKLNVLYTKENLYMILPYQTLSLL
jgi:hypothetical protein